jgi:putative phosphoesterase
MGFGMKVAFFADIHANLPALNAAAEAARDCDAIVCCGDLVGYYADPEEVCHFFRERAISCVAGNHDLIATGQLAYDERNEVLYRVHWTRAQLSVGSRAWLAALPSTIVFEWAGVEVVVRHASPWDATTYLYPDSDAIERVSLAERQILVVGHTHRQMNRKVDRGTLINPGSIGQPRGDEPAGASFAVFDTAEGVFEHRRVPYDWRAYQVRLEAAGWADAALRRLAGSQGSR